MKTRPIGTLIGCVVEFLIHPLLPGLPGQLGFALVMISLMYCATPAHGTTRSFRPVMR